MSKTSEDLLIIYESEAEQWASYLRFHLAGSIPESGICCYDIAMVTSRKDDFLRLAGYKCKLLILSRGMLEGVCQLRRFFLARVLRPEACVVILLCGVESVDPLLELVPLKGESCLQISSEQEPQEYCSAVTEIVHRGGQMPVQELKLEKKLSACSVAAKPTLLVLPNRMLCESPGEIFILLQEVMTIRDAEVEFSGKKQTVRVKPVNRNESTLCVSAPDFTVGDVCVTLYCQGVVKGKACIQYYTMMGEVAHYLQQVADPVKFMCQAFQVPSMEKLDKTLAACLLKKMPTGGFQGLQNNQLPAWDGLASNVPEDIPTLLHFAAQHGLRDLAGALLQCPGAIQALKTPNSYGYTPLDLAHMYGYKQLHILLKESLENNDGNGVYELMGKAENLQLDDADAQCQNDDEDPENIYSPMGRDDEEYDILLTSSGSLVMANRPPAPTPRPDCLSTPEDKTPFIVQVFQKRKSQDETLYSLPPRQAKARDSLSSTYDTFVPTQPPGLDELIKLQEHVKTGALSIDDALDQFNDWQRLQRGMDSVQQEKIQQLKASIINNREPNESFYDKISIVHQSTPSPDECRRASKQMETDFYSKPLKGQKSHIFKKTDKR